MKTYLTSMTALVCLLIMSLGFVVRSQTGVSDPNKTLSPYFFIQSDSAGVDQMPLRETGASVNIAGAIANVIINQVYENKGTRAIEAIYIFPASTRAAVYALQMTIGERTIVAQIREREQARKEYEEAVSQGKTASLLEQKRPNVFQMNVANIMPGDIIRVELKYTELLVPTDGIYEFVYPTVVGPRYSNTTAEIAGNNEQWIGNPYLSEGKLAPYGFDIRTNLYAGMPVRDVRSPSHGLNINYKNKNTVEVSLKDGGSEGGNRDYVLQYRLAGFEIETGLLLLPGEKENFFVAMIEGPAQPRPEQIPPREYVFIVDVSGSMSGFPLEVSKKLLEDLIGNLRPVDKFNVLLFAGASSLWSPASKPATKENIAQAISHINRQQGGGGTELITALTKAMALPGGEDYARTFIIVTDGYVSVEKQSFELIRNNLGNANFFAFGIGSSVNRYIIEGIAKTGRGEPFVVLDMASAPAIAGKFRTYIEAPVLTKVRVSFVGFDAYDVEPGMIPDVFAQRPVMLVGKYRGAAQGSIVLEGISGGGKYRKEIPVSSAMASSENTALRYLWARERIARLDDYSGGEGNKDEVTALGINYNLLTRYTSFVAIDSQIRNADGKPSTVTQPLPLPQGVSNLAVGVSANSGMYSVSGSVSSKQIRSVADYNDISFDLEEPVEEVFQVVEEQPHFDGGEAAMIEFFKKNMKYPEAARQSGISGKVYVEFTVKPDGSVADVRVVRGIGGGCSEEAIRLVKLTSGKWKPGVQRGKSVSTRMVLPVEFRLN